LDATLAQLDALGVFDAFGGSAALFPQNVVFDLGSLENVKVSTKNTWDDWSPRLVVDYHFNDQVMAFASLAKGYKAGGYNATAVNSRFDNENVWNLEAGIKTSFPDQHLAFNASVFTYRYENRQAVRVIQDPDSNFPRIAIDTSDQEAWGLDMDARWRPLQGLTLDANASFIDSTYKSYLTPEGLDLGGKPTGEPFWSFAGGINYVLGLGDGGDIELSLREAYRGKRRCNDDSRSQFLCLSNAAFDPAKAQWRTDARVAWNSADHHWSVAVYGNNLLNDRYVVDVRDFSTSAFGTPVAVLNTPRMYGLELRASF
jgi:iron complex outermembrane receptor protein